MKKKKESIWTTDLTPHFVRVMTMDITPDFSSEFWSQDITHHMVITLAVFGLVVSSFFTVMGVASAGVNIELAFAQQASEVTQTASVANAVTASAVLLPNAAAVALASTTPTPPPIMSTNVNASSTMFCPQLMHTVGRGSDDATSTGDVTELQEFMASHFGLAASTTVSGHFGPVTQGLLERFQQEQGIPPAPSAGPLTRAAIAKLCGGNGQGSGRSPGGSGNGQMGSTTPGQGGPGSGRSPGGPGSNSGPGNNNGPMGSTTPVVGSTTPPMPRQNDHRGPPPAPTTTAAPVSYIDNSSNSASVVQAVNEIGDGYTKLFEATLNSLGLY